MRRVVLLTALALAAPPLAACTSRQGGAGKFQGEQKAVAQVVSDLSDAGRRKQPQKICTDILAPTLVSQLKTAGGDCVAEMTKAIDDADDFALTVESVRVQGSQAQAVVKQGGKGPTATFSFAKQNGRWRASSLGG